MEAGIVQAVIVLALDRLGRRTRIVLDLVERLAVANVLLVSCKESLDTSTPQGRFVLTIFAAIAQLEHGLIAKRTKAGQDYRGVQDGEKSCGQKWWEAVARFARLWVVQERIAAPGLSVQPGGAVRGNELLNLFSANSC